MVHAAIAHRTTSLTWWPACDETCRDRILGQRIKRETRRDHGARRQTLDGTVVATVVFAAVHVVYVTRLVGLDDLAMFFGLLR